MRIEKIEKVILTKEEFNIIEKFSNIIENIYDVCNEMELEKHTLNIIEPLRDFIDNVKIELEK